MKVPKTIMTYCPNCGRHTPHEISRIKKRRASELKWGQRRFRKVTAGYGGFPRPKPEGREKPTKRYYIKYTCTVCKKSQSVKGRRAKKFEIAEV